MKILLLEDDPVIGSNITDYLADTHAVTHCFDPQEALKLLDTTAYDLYIFDINLPGTSGTKLLETLRSFNDTTPTIFITAYQDLDHLKEGFKVGANDFLRKPFELEELAIRIENLKQQYNLDTTLKVTDDIHLDTLGHQLFFKDKSLTIASKESAILKYLISNQNHIVSQEELLHNLWDYEEMPTGETIRTYIKKLRQLIGKEHIITIRGAGYRFK